MACSLYLIYLTQTIQATVIAACLLTDDAKAYGTQPFVISGICKHEDVISQKNLLEKASSALQEHQAIICTVLPLIVILTATGLWPSFVSLAHSLHLLQYSRRRHAFGCSIYFAGMMTSLVTWIGGIY